MKGAILLKGGGGIVESFGGVWKPQSRYDVLDVRYLVNTYPVWILNDTHVKIEEFWTFIAGHNEVLPDPNK